MSTERSDWWKAERERIPPEQWPHEQCPRGCSDEQLISGPVFTVYRCKECGYEEWL